MNYDMEKAVKFCTAALDALMRGDTVFKCPLCSGDAHIKRAGRRWQARCERCGKPYTVTAGAQKYCPKCQPVHSLEHDRENGLKYYHEHAGQINPPRNEKRRIGLTKCVICGKEFDANHTCRNTCSRECKLALIKQNQRRADAKRSPRKKGGSSNDK